MGLFDNKVVDFLPSKLESLVDKFMTKAKGGIKYPRWDIGSDSLSRVYGKGDELLHTALSPIRELGGSTEGRSNFQDVLRDRFGDAYKGISTKLAPEDWKAIMSSDKKGVRATNINPAITRLIQNLAHSKMLADPDRKIDGGMSVARFLGHAVQTGAAGAGALSLPYILKRHKQIKETEDEERQRNKRASSESHPLSIDNTVAQFFKFMKSDSPKDFYKDVSGPGGNFNPVKSYSPFVLPAGLLAMMGTYGLTKKHLMSATDKLSDRKMEKLEDKRKQELARLMRHESQKSASYPAGWQGSTLALWAFLAPLFYRFGKSLGKDTTDAAQHSKLENALAEEKNKLPTRFKFVPSQDERVGIRPGDFLGETIVDLPIPNRNKPKGKQETDQDDSSIFI